MTRTRITPKGLIHEETRMRKTETL